MATQRAAPTAWLPPKQSALTPARQADGALAKLQIPRTLTPPQSSRGPALALLAQRDVQSPGASSLIDSGILLGDGRRIGWSPGGCFAQTGNCSCVQYAVSWMPGVQLFLSCLAMISRIMAFAALHEVADFT